MWKQSILSLGMKSMVVLVTSFAVLGCSQAKDFDVEASRFGIFFSFLLFRVEARDTVAQAELPLEPNFLLLSLVLLL